MVSNNLPADEAKEDVEEAQIKQMVALTLLQVPESRQAEELNISRRRVRKLRNSERFKLLLKEEGDRAVQAAREHFRSQLDNLAPLAYSALKRNLEEGKIEAVRLFAEVAGMKRVEEEKAQDTVLQIIMPGAEANPAIEVKSEVVEE